MHFDNKLFVRAKTRSLFHIPMNMGSAFKRTFGDIRAAGAQSEEEFVVLSRDLSPWSSEHYFAVTKDVQGHEMVRLSGEYLTKVFEGPYKDAPKWEAKMETMVEGRGHAMEKIYFFFTTCPRCAKFYGKNYVVAVAKLH
jgi:hypothetical protein